MIKVAILDDYQNVSQEFIDLKKLDSKYEIKVFSEPFIDENDAIEQLNDFEALLIMRERTIISEKLISGLKKLKYIILLKLLQVTLEELRNYIEVRMESYQILEIYYVKINTGRT